MTLVAGMSTERRNFITTLPRDIIFHVLLPLTAGGELPKIIMNELLAGKTLADLRARTWHCDE